MSQSSHLKCAINTDETTVQRPALFPVVGWRNFTTLTFGAREMVCIGTMCSVSHEGETVSLRWLFGSSKDYLAASNTKLETSSLGCRNTAMF